MDLFQLTSLLTLGFLLGLKHALDADHVIAVSTIVSQTKSLRKSVIAGLFWGLGHSLTLVLLGMVILLLKTNVPVNLALFFELVVGIMLVLLGLDVLRKLGKEKYHLHKHKHDGIEHLHLHSHKTSNSHSHAHKSFWVGIVHGLAGSATLMLLILATVHSFWQGITYILIFGLGSVIGMLIVSGMIGIPFLFSLKTARLDFGVKFITGLSSITLGLIVIHQIVLISI